MSSSKTNTKLKEKFRKEFLQNSSISKCQERVLRPDNANEVCLHRTRIYQKTVYRTSGIDNGSPKPSPGNKVESKKLLHKCELIAEIEKQLKHLQGQQKYLQMTKERQKNQSWKESLLANQSSKAKMDLSQQECTKKLPDECDIDTRQVCALLRMLLKKSYVKVTNSSTQIETPIGHKKINGQDYPLSYQTENVHLSSGTSSVNVLWKAGTNSLKLKNASVKMVDSATQVGRPVGGPKNRSTQVSVKIAGSNQKVNNPLRVPKQRLGRIKHPPSSESSKSSPTYKRAEREAKDLGKSITNQRDDYNRKQSKSYYKPIKNSMEPQVKKEEHTRNSNTNKSSKSVPVQNAVEKRISRSPKLYLAEIEEMKASPRKTVRTLRREYKTTSEYRNIQSSFKTNCQQMVSLADLHSPIRNQISRQTFTISAQRINSEKFREKDSPNSGPGTQRIVSSTRKNVQTHRASQIAYINSHLQSYKDSKHEHHVKNPNDLLRESHATPQWNSMSVRSNVIDDRTYIIPDTDRSEEYIILPYVHSPNYLESRDKLSKIEKSSVILEDASSREYYVNTSKTSRVIENTMQDMSNNFGPTQPNTSMLDQFNRSTRSQHNKIGSMPFKHQAKKSNNSDASLRNRSSNSGKMPNKLRVESDITSVSALPQEHQGSDTSRRSSQKNTSFRSHPSELKDESIRLEVTNNHSANTPTSRSNPSDAAHMSDLTDISITNHSHQTRNENVINSELKKIKDMSHQLKSSHELQNNVSKRTNSINSDPRKHEDISYESDFIHELQKITTSPKYENKDELLKSKTDLFKTVQNKEHLSKSKIGRKEEYTEIIYQTEPKAFKSENNISISCRKNEWPSKSVLVLKSPPNRSESVTSADQSTEMTCSDRSFTLKPVALLKIDEDADGHCIRQQRGEQQSEGYRGSTLKTEEKVFVNSKIAEVNDFRTSPEMLTSTLVNPNIYNDNAETYQRHDSISGTATITEMEIPSATLNYIQYLQNRLKDCDQMVEKQTYCQRETFQRNEVGLKVEHPPNFESGGIAQKNSSFSSLIKREGSIEGLEGTVDSISKFEESCCCSCCGEEQSTSYHSDIPLFTGCDCMKEGYYQIMQLAYGK